VRKEPACWVRDDLRGTGSKYEVLPGVHSVGISLQRTTNQIIVTKVEMTKRDVSVSCFQRPASRPPAPRPGNPPENSPESGAPDPG
jgi:hypothetical protein